MKLEAFPLFLLFAVAPGFAAAPVSLEQPGDDPVVLAPFHVDGQVAKAPTFERLYLKLDHMFDGPFIETRGGQLIEAIVWRHHYVRDHPGEKAIILVERDPDARVISATTVYTRAGALYASSQVLGTDFRLRGLTGADIVRTEAIRSQINGIRESYLMLNPGDLTRRQLRGRYKEVAYQLGFDTVSGDDHDLDVLGAQTALAEVTGDYSILHQLAADPFGASSDSVAGSSSDLLARAYSELRDPAEAGVVPVARRFLRLPGAAEKNGSAKGESVEAVVFDWDGVHYAYRPDGGTYGAPIPTNPLTGKPYLCITGGDLLESVAFCAAYPRVHPGEKAALIAPPHGPYGAVYTAKGVLHYFSPFFGEADLPSRAKVAFSDAPAHAQLLSLLVQRERKQLPARHQSAEARLIPRSLPGDDAGLQAVRAYLALKAEGVPVQIAPGQGRTAYVLTGQWEGIHFRHDF